MTKLGPGELRNEIAKTSAVLSEITGKPPVLMRPPYGATSPYINHWLNKEFGMTVILWSVDPLDWKIRDSAHVESEILAGARSGAIILSHDIHATTVEAMPDTLDALIAKGYKFVTVSELIAMNQTAPSATQKPSAPTISRQPLQ